MTGEEHDEEKQNVDADLEQQPTAPQSSQTAFDEGNQSSRNGGESMQHDEHVAHAVDLVRNIARQRFNHLNRHSMTNGGIAAPSFNLRVHFPNADREKLRKLEELLEKDGRYLATEQATLKRFLMRQLSLNFQLDEKRAKYRKFTWADLLVAGMLSTALLLSTPARTHLNGLAGLMIIDDPVLDYSVTKHSEVIYAAVIATAIGRVISGFVIDLHDPIIMFGVFALGSAATVVFMSQFHQITAGYDENSQLTVLQILAGFESFFNSGIFASGVKFLHDHFRPAQWGIAVTIFAIGGRLGAIVSILSMGSIVSARGNWENGSAIACYMCFSAIIPLLIIRLFPHPADHLVAPSLEEYWRRLRTHEAFAPPRERVRYGFTKCDRNSRTKDWHHFLEAGKRVMSWWQRPSFFLMACANAGMAVSFSPEGFDGLLPLFTSRAFNLNPGLESGTVLMFYHIGAIISLCTGGLFLERLARAPQARLNLLLMFLGCCSLAGLVGLTSQGESNKTEPLSAPVRAVYFFIGLGFGYPFFVTVNKFAINWGGEHSALVVQTLQVFALSVCAAADASFGVFAATSWTIVVGIVLAFNVEALFAMLFFDFHEWRRKQKLKQQGLQDAISQLVASTDKSAPSSSIVVPATIPEKRPVVDDEIKVTLIENGVPTDETIKVGEVINVVEESQPGGRVEDAPGGDEPALDIKSHERHPDATHKGVNVAISIASSVVILAVICGLLTSYSFSRITVQYGP